MTDEYHKRRLSILASLADRVAIVTGADQGFGYAIAERLAEAGAAVGLVDIDVASAQRAVDRIRRWAPAAELLAVRADVTEPAEVEDAFTTVEDHLGPVDILINNAGVYSNYMFLEMPISEFDRIQRVNLRGVFLCSQRAARPMKERGGGVIVHIASVDALGSSAQGLTH